MVRARAPSKVDRDRDTLPKTLVPSHYEISIFDIALGAPWTYQGHVRLHGEIIEMTNKLILNANQLKIHEAQVYTEESKTESSVKANDISYDEKAQKTIFTFPGTLPTSPRVTVDIKYEGTMNNHMAGFYRSKYKPTVTAAKSVPQDEEHHYMFSTQFESCDARRAFPCCDEPNLKATFDLDIEIPEDQTALSNMPEKETRKGSKEGLKVVAFDKTPVMSTYLLAWAFGDFEYVEAFTKRKYNGKNLPVRVYTTRGLKEQGQYALDHAHQVIDYFSEVFKIDYPLPKSDLLAVHEFSHGAMENWGLVTYRTTAVLFDEKNSDARYKNRVAYVVAHELAHQWFGNLVTMDWWSELWLNEGFATWVGWFAIDHLHPEWNVWAQFVTEGYQTAFNLDGLRTSHPIEVPVKDALEVEQIFDAISYLKGSSVIRMLSSHLTAKTFLDGVSDYLKAHAYGNATTDDLWAALSKASGQDVKSFIDPWIRQIGFPVVTVAEEPGQLGVQQKRFLSTGDVKPQEDETIWWIPLGLNLDTTSGSNVSALTTRSETLRGVDESFYKLNADQTGFYRTNYPPERLQSLGKSLGRLSVQDKIGLIGDAAALSGSGDATTAGLLGFVERFQSETDFLVWSQVLSSLGHIRTVFADNEKVASGLQKFQLKLVTPAAEKLGWEFKDSEDYLTSQLRSLLISAAGLAGHEGIIAEAKKQFQAYMFDKNKSAIHQNLRSTVWRIAITNDTTPASYQAVKEEFLTTSSVDGREIALQSMGRVQTQELGKEYFDFLLSDRVPIQDIHSGGIALGANAKTRRVQWHCIKDDWEPLKQKISGNPVVMDRYLRTSLNKFASHEVQDDIAKFFADKDNRGYDRSLGIVSDTIAGNASHKDRDEKLVLEWLQAGGYV